jgi:hypothetical protein
LKAKPDDLEVKAAYNAGLNDRIRATSITDIRQTPVVFNIYKKFGNSKSYKKSLLVSTEALRELLEMIPDDPWVQIRFS